MCSDYLPPWFLLGISENCLVHPLWKTLKGRGKRTEKPYTLQLRCDVLA
jgi:hypothetical protein